MLEIYPWQNKEWQHLLERFRPGKLPHALLFVGSEGLGKTQLAESFAQLLLCKESNAAKACGNCVSCRLLLAGNHPDFLRIGPEESGKQIKIDQIRFLSESLSQTSQQGGYKVVLIAPADAMNLSSANALLKTLEEPESDTILILVTSRPHALPATVRSRCQLLPFATPPSELAKEWLLSQGIRREDSAKVLNFTAGAPLRALELATNKEFLQLEKSFFSDLLKIKLGELSSVVLATKYADYEPKIICDLLLIALQVLMENSIGSEENIAVYGGDLAKFCAALSSKVNGQKLFYYWDKILQIRQALLASISLNKQFLLEDLFLTWLEV